MRETWHRLRAHGIEQRECLAAVTRLDSMRRAGEPDDHQAGSRQMIRIGAVNAVTVPLVTPVMREFRARASRGAGGTGHRRQADIRYPRTSRPSNRCAGAPSSTAAPTALDADGPDKRSSRTIAL